MNKKDKNLEKRREFYIPYVSRNGKNNDDEIIRESPIIKKTASSSIVPPTTNKPNISYAESVGYRESPKRYDNLRPKKDLEEDVINEISKNDTKKEATKWHLMLV